jgi:zinc transport system ATP-binding protein
LLYYDEMNVPPVMKSALLAAENVSVSYRGARILDSVSLSIRPGEIVTLIGPNGSGKTTLIRVLLGLIPPETGRVVKDTQRIGYVPQIFVRDRSLPMTALRFCVLFSGAYAREALAALERTGVAHVAERQLSALSGGEMARVALARAILKRPELLVLDEPLAGVDISGEAALYELIASLRTELSAGVLLVSHDLHVVMAAADHVVCLNHHVCCEGDAGSVAKNPSFIQLFGTGVAEQIAVYSHHHDHSHAPSGAVEHRHRDAHHG